MKKLLERFIKKNQKTNQREFRIEKENKGKGNKLYAKVKGYDNSFNKSTDKKCIVIWKIFIFPLYGNNKNEIKVDSNLSNYATKSG